MRVTLNETSQSEWQRDNLEHLRFEYDLHEDDVVLDVGAYRGEFAEAIYRRYHCRLIVVEPTDSIVGFELGTVIHKAAWVHPGVIRTGGQFYYTSQYEEGAGEYPCIDINPLIASLPEISLCKINIEGAEYELLKHIIGAGLHHKIRNFQVQFHQIEGEPFDEWYQSIAAALSETHDVQWKYPFCWESWRLKASA